MISYIQILIDMFIIRSLSTLPKAFRKFAQITCLSTLPFKSTKALQYEFVTRKWNKKQFLKKLDKEIIDSHAQICWQDPETQAFFKRQQWKIRYIQEKTLFEYSKIVDQHEIRILTYVMYAPPNDPDHAEDVKAQKDDPNKKINYAQVGIYVRKKGAQKWLTAEMAVLQGSIELLGVFFTSLEPSFNWNKGIYSGPQLKTLPEQIISGINTVFVELGLEPQLIMNMVIHASIKVDPLDLEWLKNLRQIWGE